MDPVMLRQTIRASAELLYSRSGGPGGQNVNKVNTKVTLRLSLDALAGPRSGLSEPELARLRERLAGRITKDGGIVVHADGERSRRSNEEDAWNRIEALIRAAARLPKKRRPTKPSRAAREARLREKHKHGDAKKERGYRGDE